MNDSRPGPAERSTADGQEQSNGFWRCLGRRRRCWSAERRREARQGTRGAKRPGGGGRAGLADLSLWLSTGRGAANGGAIAWLAAGALSALVLLGAFSYGPYLLPAVLALAGAALLADRRRARSALHHLGLFVTGALGCALVVVLANLGGWL